MCAENLSASAEARHHRGMDKVAIQVHGAPSFFAEIASEAARIDRSPSWLVSQCLRTWLPSLADAEASDISPAPRGKVTDTRVYWLPRDLLDQCAELCAKLDVPSDALLASAWERRQARS
jgi:hypothetical protein